MLWMFGCIAEQNEVLSKLTVCGTFIPCIDPSFQRDIQFLHADGLLSFCIFFTERKQ